MSEAIGYMLPTAVAAIVLSLPAIVIMILLLEPSRDQRLSLGFVTGWLLSFVVSCGIFLFAAELLSSDNNDERANWVSVLLLLIGLGLLAFAGKKVANRPRAGQPAKPSAITRTIDKLTPTGAIPFGALLGGFNPKFLAVIGSLAAELTLTNASVSEQAVVMLLFTVIGSAGIIGPVIAIRIGGESAAGVLRKVSDFLNKFTWLIMALIVGYFGIKLIGDALRAFI